jgi:hypothetical protein
MKLAAIVTDADFFTKHPGISTRSLYTMEELCPEEYRKLDSEEFQAIPVHEFEEGWKDYEINQSFNPD